MAFILLLIISLSSLLAVESQGETNTSKKNIARQNGLLALQVALGELQKSTGPDQRITATSSILDSDPSTETIEGQNEIHWTGVWDSSGELRTWLVSGNQGRLTTDKDFVKPDTVLVTPVSMGPEVNVPKVEFATDSAYAFWISDEGTKAKINLPDRGLPTTPLLSAQKIDISQMSGLGWTRGIGSGQRKRILDLDSLKITANDPIQRIAVDTHTHDLTAASYSLLTNTANGGFKKDLTLALFDNSGMPTGQIFGPQTGAASDRDPGGPAWLQLQSWATVGTGDLPVRPQSNSQTGFFPVITQFQLYVVPRYGPAPEYEIYLELFPAITLWNPYDKSLEATDYRLDIGRTFRETDKPNQFNYYDTLFEFWNIRVEGDALHRLVSNQATGLNFNLSNVSLAPGEAVTYSPPPGKNDLDQFAKHARPAYGENELSPGFRPNATYLVETGFQLPPTSSTFVAPNFQVIAHISISKSVALIRRSDDSVVHEVLYLSGNSNSAAESPMEEAGDPTASMDGSVGIKAVRNFVEGNHDLSVKWIAHNNPRAATQGPLPLYFHNKTKNEIEASEFNNPSFAATMTIDGDEFDTGLPVTGSNAGVGYSVNPVYAQASVLFESPPSRARLHSLGQLMHAPLYNPDLPGTNASHNAKHRLIWGRFDNLLPAYAIGNSLADPYIPLGAVYVDWTDHPPTNSWATDYANVLGVHYDHSFLLNEALWDDYFFSTLPSSTSRSPSNPRLIPIDPAATSTMQSEEVAADFMIDGGFNINSTSEGAWRSVLAAFFGETVAANQPESAPFLRVHNNPGAYFDDATHDALSASAYHGYRALTSDQIINLAHQIVKEIKWRGPFTSLAEFVNRNPNEDAPSSLPEKDAFRLQGAVAAALAAADAITSSEASDLGVTQADAEINTSLQSATEATIVRTEPGFTQKAQAGWRTEGIPGWMTQADLLARLGAVITPRSDTFKIHFQGEYVNPIQGSAIQARGEATVQRIPDYIDNSESADTATTALTETENIRFGRRYVVVNLRWIDNS